LSAADVKPANACNSASNLAFGTVPLARLEAFKFVKLLAFAAIILPLASNINAFAAGKVQNIVFVPALQLTALLEFVLASIEVLAKVVPEEVNVPNPTSKSVPSVHA